MPPLRAEDVTRIDQALQSWRQGDVAFDEGVFFLHLADLATQRLQAHLKRQHNRHGSEGAHLQALREIRIRAAPSWEHPTVSLFLWFVKEADPAGFDPAWHDYIDKWMDRLDAKGRFTVDDAVVCGLEDMTARDYVESDRLDLDQLSSQERHR